MTRDNSLTQSEIERLLDQIETFEDLTLIKLALNSGIRREDLVSIDLSGVDLKNAKITFYERKKRNYHTIPIFRAVYPDLFRYIKQIPKKQKKLFDFTGKTAYNRLQHYLNKAGIKKPVSFHDLRRTFVKIAQKRGISTQAICQVTNDKKETILKYYSTLSMEELKEEVDKE